MKVNESKMKYYTKYKVNSASILDASAKNKAISIFLILKIPFLIHWKVETLDEGVWV